MSPRHDGIFGKVPVEELNAEAKKAKKQQEKKIYRVAFQGVGVQYLMYILHKL